MEPADLPLKLHLREEDEKRLSYSGKGRSQDGTREALGRNSLGVRKFVERCTKESTISRNEMFREEGWLETPETKNKASEHGKKEGGGPGRHRRKRLPTGDKKQRESEVRWGGTTSMNVSKGGHQYSKDCRR